jgi:hypothetical protein
LKEEHNLDRKRRVEMINNPLFNEMILVADKKTRKGDGATAILSLMSSTLDFLDKVDVCIEAVANPVNNKRLEEYKVQVETMYTEMAEMSKGAIRQISNEDAVEVVTEGVEEVVGEEVEEAAVEATEPPIQTEKPITMVNAPVVPKL